MKGRMIKLTAVLASAVIGTTGCGVSAVDQSMPEVVAVSGAVDESADVAKGAPEDGTTLAQVPAESEGKTNDESEKVIEESEAVEDSEEVANEGEKAVDESSKAIEESEESKTNTDGTNMNSTAKGTASDDAAAERAAAAKAEAERQAAEKAEAERQAAAAKAEAERQAAANQGQSSAVNQVGSQFEGETPEERQARLERQAAEAAQKSAEYEAAKKAAEEEAARKAAEEEAARQQEERHGVDCYCECGAHFRFYVGDTDDALVQHMKENGCGRFGAVEF